MCGSTCSTRRPRRAPRHGSISAARCFCCCRSRSRSSVFALPYVERSWATLERSRETSGLPLVFLLKTLIPLFALLLALAGRGAGDTGGLASYPSPERGGCERSERVGSRRGNKTPPRPLRCRPSPFGGGMDAPPRTPRDPDGDRRLRPAVRRLSGGADARRRVVRVRGCSATRSARWTLACCTHCRSASSA